MSHPHAPIVDFVMGAESRGLSFAVKGGAILVSPKEAITQADAAFIRANKPALLSFLAEEDEVIRPTPPPGAPIIVADERGRTASHGKAMEAAFMWTWIGHETWYYVRDYPVPISSKKG